MENKKNDITTETLDATRFFDECQRAFDCLKTERGVGLFSQFVAVQYAMLKRIESRIDLLEKEKKGISETESRKESDDV